MCGRFYMDPEQAEIRKALEQMNRSPLRERFEKDGGRVTDGGEVCPGDVAPALARNRAGGTACFPMRWGYRTEIGGKPRMLINARSETAANKPLFSDGFRTRRCLLPMSGYFEWEHLKTPDSRTRTGRRYTLRPRDAGPCYLAGLYRLEEGLPVFVVLTRAPSPDVSALHDRMPVLLAADCADAWLNPHAAPEQTLGFALTRIAALAE